jgi:hypothetical protein
VKILETLHWDNTSLKPPKGLPSDHKASIAAHHKQRHEEREQSAAIRRKAAHYRVETFAAEGLEIKVQDQGKGAAFNRDVNNSWQRDAFLSPTVKGLLKLGVQPVKVEAGHSSKIGNQLGWQYRVTDPACAAMEIGRRALQDPIDASHIQRFIWMFRVAFLCAYWSRLQELIARAKARATKRISADNSAGELRIKARHRRKEATLEQWLPTGTMLRSYYRHQWEKRNQIAPCTRRFYLKDLLANLPSGSSLRLASFRSPRSKVLAIATSRVDDLIIPVPGRIHIRN